ncbi:winged helix-turn-helix transcriptional regulator [Saccharothrix variisporea]|uniref:HxlR family transcriptional regulator n=1 Tax=Saccharothrix variisporea TaxID=543527 RepID=A0A495WYQ9_9PSEU|nr:helix-turn-helix domain-containing protein [Saccharothrix variisporea]RKT66971.1 HxlR family transcriptional regulator [Saccharothrix variisporea]
MASKRKYEESCAAAHALDLVGERWALLVVRELLFGPKRFTDLRAGIPGASPDVLSQRLRQLERAGVVRRRKLPPPAGTRVYDLTAWGRELEPVIVGFGRWGGRSPGLDHRAAIGADAVMLAFKTLFDPRLSAGCVADVFVRVGGEGFRVSLSDNEIDVRRGDAAGADAVVVTDPATLHGIVWGTRSPAEAEAAGEVAVQGDRDRFACLLSTLAPPEPAAAERNIA